MMVGKIAGRPDLAYFLELHQIGLAWAAHFRQGVALLTNQSLLLVSRLILSSA